MGGYGIPVILDLVFNGWQRVFSYFAADTFYYLVVARNFALKGIFSFDGEFPTNGFHPLWQVLTGFFYKGLLVFDLPQPVILVSFLGLSMLTILTSIWIIAQVFRRCIGYLPAWYLLLLVGPYALIMAPIFHRYGTLWSFTNAMETPAVILFYSLLMWLMVQKNMYQSKHQVILTGLVLSNLFLSRLDHIFIVLTVEATLLVRTVVERKWKDGFSAIFLIGLITAAVLGLYMTANQVYSGSWLPVSGAIKSTFPSPIAGQWKLNEIKQVLGQINTPDFGPGIWRYTQLVLPMAFALVIFIFYSGQIFRRKIDDLGWFWWMSATSALFIGFYNFLFVPTLDQGHWYFPVSILFVAIFTVYMLERLLPQRFSYTASLILVGLVSLFFLFVYHDPTYNQRYVWFYDEAEYIRAYYDGSMPELIEYDDGIIAYTTGFQTLAGFGFCLDKEAFQALQENRLLDLAFNRGYRYIASYYYFGFGRFSHQSTPEEIKDYLASLSIIGPREVERFNFSIDYISRDGRFSILRMELK